MRDFEDLLAKLQIYGYIDPPPVKEVDRTAPDVIAEVNRYKKEQREATKKAAQHKPITHNLPNTILDMMVLLSGGNGVVEHHKINFLAFKEYRAWFEECAPIPEETQRKLGISVDNSALSLWDQRHIRWQAGAQVLWYNKHSTVTSIQQEMLSNPRLFELMELNVLTSIYNNEKRVRALEDAIRLVNPKQGERRGRPSTERNDLCEDHEIVLIPKVYNNQTQQINLKALRITVETLSQTLRLLDLQTRAISTHPIISKYKTLLPSSIKTVIDMWI